MYAKLAKLVKAKVLQNFKLFKNQRVQDEK